jgi:hypothetical protein
MKDNNDLWIAERDFESREALGATTETTSGRP